MNEQTIFIIQTDILGNQLYSSAYAYGEDIPRRVANKILWAIIVNPQLIGATFHDKASGNFYKAVYSI